MKKIFIALFFPTVTALMLCGCGEDEESRSDVTFQPNITALAIDTHTQEPTPLTTCTTLKRFADITKVTKMNFAEITRMKINGMIGNGRLIPWGDESSEAVSERNETEETEIKKQESKGSIDSDS